MLNRHVVLTDYQIALGQYRNASHERDKTLNALKTCYEALARGVVHGKKEQSMIVKIKELNGILFTQSVLLAKLDIKLQKSARSKF